MSDLLNPTFKNEEDDDSLLYGDEDLTGVSEEGEATESAEVQPADQKKAEEILFAVTGEDGKEQQLPFAKLTPKQVKEWYDDHSNKHAWNQSNTEKAKAVADERRAFEVQKQQFETVHKQVELWENFFKSNPGLQELVTAFVQRRIPQQLLTQILGQPAGQQAVGAQPTSGLDPYLNQVVQRLSTVEQQLRKEQEVRQQDRQLSEREKAMQAILPNIPEEKREAFKEYMAQVTANMTDLQAMYKIVADSYLWANKDELIQKVKQQAIEELRKKQGAGVETGEQQSAVELPKNVELSGTRDIGRDYEAFADQLES